MSANGSPDVATRSANLPAAIEPTSFCHPIMVAFVIVPDWMARAGAMPPSLTSFSNSTALVPCTKKVPSTPVPTSTASFGVAAHAVLRTVGDYSPERLAAIEARFSRPVFPGDTIRTEMWPQDERIYFQCRAAGRGDVVLSNGLAVLRA